MLPQAPGLAFCGGSFSSPGVLPVIFGIAMGVLVGAVQHGNSLTAPLAFAGVAFILLQVLIPIHTAIGANLGDRSASWLYDQLTEACIRPPGMGHLEDATLTNDLTVARDFDLGMTGPPLSIAMDFTAGGLVKMIAGVASAVVLAFYAWWAPLLLAARGCPHTGCSRKARSGAIATRRRSAARSAMPTMRTASRSTRRRRRNCGCSGLRTGRSNASRGAGRAFTSCNTKRRGCANSRCSSACCWSAGPTCWCSGRWPTAPPKVACHSQRSSSSRRQPSARPASPSADSTGCSTGGAPVSAMMRLSRPCASRARCRRGRARRNARRCARSASGMSALPMPADH